MQALALSFSARLWLNVGVLTNLMSHVDDGVAGTFYKWTNELSLTVVGVRYLHYLQNACAFLSNFSIDRVSFITQFSTIRSIGFKSKMKFET
ncbi:MAG: hypothetical protein A3I66_20215 [Burkholderiales bacterium RIFCSPLOWO2_02_FULL_57_36]|nr:MAG: hypothetical protein A3I66_20215 [Burkholderiales bacterium RIFCSPLOWO2_02_FULL_57_36]